MRHRPMIRRCVDNRSSCYGRWPQRRPGWLAAGIRWADAPMGGRFAPVEPRRRMAAFVRGLLAGLPRVNCWSIAEHAWERCPRGMQQLLSAAVSDDVGVHDDLRGYVLEHFAHPSAVLVVDESGDLKKGTATGGTQQPPGPS